MTFLPFLSSFWKRQLTQIKFMNIWEHIDRHTWSSYVILHGHGIHWRMANGGQLKGLLSIILFYN